MKLKLSASTDGSTTFKADVCGRWLVVVTPRQDAGAGAARFDDVKPSTDATLNSKSSIITSLGIANVDRFIVVVDIIVVIIVRSFC